ncbi:hypothetical protein B0H67DRAFT_560581 [Lasiosphaeris hirsuta]|uniref:Uncharacterized protein n=1 Tax=Lasiosphaeris hirsuta TaxID=260670 RepID=A0AA40B9E6_9PEZI|nr:hypothetical protein B0H67DRAFT_560581 [Lasiosphaeris hirsuta]
MSALWACPWWTSTVSLVLHCLQATRSNFFHYNHRHCLGCEEEIESRIPFKVHSSCSIVLCLFCLVRNLSLPVWLRSSSATSRETVPIAHLHISPTRERPPRSSGGTPGSRCQALPRPKKK